MITIPEQARADPALPQLEALLDPARMSEVFATKGISGEVSIQLVRHKTGRRAILRYDVTHAGAGPEIFFGKTFASDRGPRVFKVMTGIAGARAFGDVAVPEPVAWFDGIKMLLMRGVPGLPVLYRLVTNDGAVAENIAGTVCRFHRSGVELGRRHDLDKELAPLVDRIADVERLAPHLAHLAHACLHDIHAARSRVSGWRWRPVHRDFYHDQILIDDDRLVVLDLDDATMSEPAVDIANFSAHLRLLGIQERRDPQSLGDVRRAFVDRARALDSDLDLRLLQFLEAATLLRLAGIYISRANGDRIAEMLLAECRNLLAE